MKRTIICTFLLLAFHLSFAQISLFKDINTLEAGSNPANFVEVNGLVFFTVQKFDGYYLWKSDGTEAGTTQISEQQILVNSTNNSNFSIPTLFIHNNEVYYQVQNILTNVKELWKSDGITNTLVQSNFYANQLVSYNNDLFAFKFNGLFKILNNTEILIKTLPNTLANEKIVVLNNEMIFYTIGSLNGNSNFQLWKSNGTEAGTFNFKTLENVINIYRHFYNYDSKTILVEGSIYFLTYRISTTNSNFETELWKTNGTDTGTLFVKKILAQNAYNTFELPQNLTKFNSKIIFNNTSKLWISDGTEAGTQVLKIFQNIGYDTFYKFYGILNDKFCFSASENNDSELWVSDGTSVGTLLLKDLNSEGSSTPNYFVTIQNKLFFRANNNNEVWQTDGSNSGTIFVQNIPKPAGSATVNTTTPEYIYTSTNQLFFKNYDSQNNYELWKSDGLTTSIVKNINTTGMGSGAYDKKVKINNTWYFSAYDNRGTELWKSDGTPEGTTIVKDIGLGSNSTTIYEMIAIGNTIYFIATSNNETFKRLWKSDGTETGTVEIPLNSGFTPNLPVNPESLTAVGQKFFFKGMSTQGQLWVSDGTATHTFPLPNISINAPISNLVGVNDKLFFTSEKLWVSDGSPTGTHIVTNEQRNAPIAPICLVEFKNKIYFFSSYFNTTGSVSDALWESDGTPLGTKIIKDFPETDNNLTSSILLFLEKTSNKLFFRTRPTVNSFDLWTSDGTNNGTVRLKTLNYSSGYNKVLTFGALGSKFFIFIASNIYGEAIDCWSSDGTTIGTQIFATKIIRKLNVTTPIPFNNKLYFGIDDFNLGHELWSSDGTLSGTRLVGDIQTGTNSSYPNGLMDFYDKIIFWGNDNNVGRELYYYSETTCNDNINYTIQSGNWDSPETWSCGRVPTDADNVIIKNSHSVTIPSTYIGFSNTIYTEKGAILTIQNNAIFNSQPK